VTKKIDVTCLASLLQKSNCKFKKSAVHTINFSRLIQEELQDHKDCAVLLEVYSLDFQVVPAGLKQPQDLVDLFRHL